MSKELVSAITTNVNVGMDEVVSVFVSRYETDLFVKKDDLSKKVKETKKELSDLDKRLESSINRAEYTHSIPTLGISAKVKDVSVGWRDEVIKVCVEVTDDDKNGGYYSSLSKDIEVPINKEDKKEHSSLSDKLDEINSELVEVLALIKSVGRKERQIRGKISEIKLQESGLSELVDNKELISLIKLD